MGKQAIYDLDVETTVPPERLLAAATDFSERRPSLWPNINRKRYRVFALNDHSADVEEATPPVHHRYHYQWTDDGIVRATTIDASAMTTGSIWELRVRPRSGGGSHVRVHVEMSLKGPMGRMAWLMMRFNGGGAATHRKWFMKTVAVLERENGAPPSD